MRDPGAVLAAMLRSDPGRPRVTCYDDSPGPDGRPLGERVELSARVLANWVAKAANCLTERYDVVSGSAVRLALPALHWRSLYWAMGVWALGGTVHVDAAPDVVVDVVVGTDPGEADVVVTLPALARRHPAAVPPGAMDEAAELATYGDLFEPVEEPEPYDVALYRHQPPHGPRHYTYREVVQDRGWPAQARVALSGAAEAGPGGGNEELGLDDVLLAGLAAWAVDGSVVLQRGADHEARGRRLATEGVTVEVR